jgi:hypothetical protein
MHPQIDKYNKGKIMSTIEVKSPDGVSHKFTSELETFILLPEWVDKNKSKEIQDACLEFNKTGVPNEGSISAYQEWLVDQKIHHIQETPEGYVIDNHYIDIENQNPK